MDKLTIMMICILLLKFQKKNLKKMKSKTSNLKKKDDWEKLLRNQRNYPKNKLTNLFVNNWVMTLIIILKMKKLTKMVNLKYRVLKHRLIWIYFYNSVQMIARDRETFMIFSTLRKESYIKNLSKKILNFIKMKKRRELCS